MLTDVQVFRSKEFPKYVSQGLICWELVDLTPYHPNAPFRITEVVFVPGEKSDIHSKKCYEVMYVVEGTLTIVSGGKEHRLEKNGGSLVIPPDVKHQHFNKENEVLRFVMIHYMASPYPRKEGSVRATETGEQIWFGHRMKLLQNVLEDGPVNID